MIDRDLYIQFLEGLIKNSHQPVKLASVKNRKNKPRYTWTDEDRERLLRLHSEGIKSAEIARIMGLRTSQVENQIYSLLGRKGVA
jgi:DNA-binding CsgD family transcriptional regulator